MKQKRLYKMIKINKNIYMHGEMTHPSKKRNAHLDIKFVQVTTKNQERYTLPYKKKSEL